MGAVIDFLVAHSLPIDWLISGDPVTLICNCARLSVFERERADDPIPALIEDHKKANAEYYAALEVVPGTLSPDPEKEELYGDREIDARWTLTSTTPTTLTGLLTLLSYIEGMSEGSCAPLGKPDKVFENNDDLMNVVAGARECLEAHLHSRAS